MRTEQEMFDLILGVAEADERVRAVYMNGSRANPNVTKDKYQDYDIVFVVTETASFLADKGWISVFGDIVMVQEPDELDIDIYGIEHDFSRSYVWLMLFKDGTRIDLGIMIEEKMLEDFNDDGLTVILLDKDNLLPQIPLSNDRNYWAVPPTKPQYDGCCNEFWWCLNNVGKGIARDELPYVMEMYNHYIRDMLNKMLVWYIGIQTDFSVSAGKMGKYFKKYLPAELCYAYTRTYSDGNYENIWAAVFTACGLFRTAASEVGRHFNYTYNQSDDENMTEYLKSIKAET
jgi:aminoglycoside 6-adenylyltransferase